MTLQVGMTGGCSYERGEHRIFIDCLLNNQEIVTVPINVLLHMRADGDMLNVYGVMLRVLPQPETALDDQLARFQGLHRPCCPGLTVPEETTAPLTITRHENGQLHIRADTRDMGTPLVARQERGNQLVMLLRGKGVIDITRFKVPIKEEVRILHGLPKSPRPDYVGASVLVSLFAVSFFALFCYRVGYE